ncbi:hypothetical protein A2U01_0091020, partial [Trifolium medium]|nr:hypothetical protein [Trifolium medium]
MDAFFGHVTVSPVIPAPLACVLVRLGRYLFWELNPTLPEFRGVALRQNVIARS